MTIRQDRKRALSRMVVGAGAAFVLGLAPALADRMVTDQPGYDAVTLDMVARRAILPLYNVGS